MAVTNDSILTFKALHPTFGAECRRVDFSQPVPKTAINSIRAAFAFVVQNPTYGVLVFRETQLNDAKHVAFAAQMGDLDDATTGIKPGQKYRLAPYFQVSDVGNVEEDGGVVSKDSVRHQGNSLFHVDCLYNRAELGILSSVLINCLEMNWRWNCKYKDLVLCHSVWHNRKLGAPESEILAQVRPEDHAMARHKLMQLHEPSGRMNMYIAWHAYHIDGWSKKESQQVIEDLLRHASQDKYTTQVDWENTGDMVIWDNTCVMHRACGGTYQGKFARDMRRATVHDSSSTAWGLNGQAELRPGVFTAEMKDAKWNQEVAAAKVD